MSQPIARAAVPPDPDRIKTHELEQLLRIAEDAREGRVSDDGALLFLMCAPAIFREALAARQRTEAGLEPHADLSNVINLPPKGGA